MATFNLTVNGKRARSMSMPTRRFSTCCATISTSKGPRFGCGLAQCGACTVHVDGEAVRSCVTAVSPLSARRSSRRSKGLGTPAKPHPLQQAFIDEQAAQCGYCINGMIMNAAALLDDEQEPERGRDPRRRWRTTSAAAAPTCASSRAVKRAAAA